MLADMYFVAICHTRQYRRHDESERKTIDQERPSWRRRLCPLHPAKQERGDRGYTEFIERRQYAQVDTRGGWQEEIAGEQRPDRCCFERQHNEQQHANGWPSAQCDVGE